MNYIRLYIKRTFTHNIKKQLFLIFVIAAFVTMLANEVMRTDANEQQLVNDSRSENYGFSAKIQKCNLEGIEFLENHEEITLVQPVEIAEVISGPSGVECVVSSKVPDTWKMDYLYGGPPGPGEVVLTDTTVIGKRQPKPGETIRLTVKVGEENRQVDAVVSGVVKGVLLFTNEYAFLYDEDFQKMTNGLDDKKRCYEVFVQNIYGYLRKGNVLSQMDEMFDVYPVVAHPTVFNMDYDLEWVLSKALRVVLLFGVSLTAVIYLIIQDDRKTIGIYRTLGAKRYQIVAMVTVRILCSGGIGTVLGLAFALLTEYVENLFTLTNTASINNMNWSSLLYVGMGVFAALLLLQLPILYRILRESPVELLEDSVNKGEKLVRLSNPKVLKVKHPLWWYSGLEGKRLKGRRGGIVLISVFVFYLVSEMVLAQHIYIQEGSSDALDATYTVRKEDGSFSKEELRVLSGLAGLQAELPEEGDEPLREITVTLQEGYKTVAKSVEEAVLGAKLVEDELYTGNSIEELTRDMRVAWLFDVFIRLLTAVVFLVCYYCFFYLEKTEEYRRLHGMGASLPMIRKIMLYEALRGAFVVAVANGIVSFASYYLVVSEYDASWLREEISLYPVAEMLILAVMVFCATMGATLFASRQVLRELEQKA